VPQSSDALGGEVCRKRVEASTPCQNIMSGERKADLIIAVLRGEELTPRQHIAITANRCRASVVLTSKEAIHFRIASILTELPGAGGT
jgi:hypothetical protein